MFEKDDFPVPLARSKGTRKWHRHYIEMRISGRHFRRLLEGSLTLRTRTPYPVGATICFNDIDAQVDGEGQAGSTATQALTEVAECEQLPTSLPTFAIKVEFRAIVSAPHRESPDPSASGSHTRFVLPTEPDAPEVGAPESVHDAVRPVRCALVIGSRRIPVELEELGLEHAVGRCDEFVEAGEHGTLCIIGPNDRLVMPCETLPSLDGRVALVLVSSRRKRLVSLLTQLEGWLPKAEIIRS